MNPEFQQLDFCPSVSPRCHDSGTDRSGPTCINRGAAQLDFALLTAWSRFAFQSMGVQARLKAELYKNTHKIGFMVG